MAQAKYPHDFQEVQRQWKAAVKAKGQKPGANYNALMQSLNACYEAAIVGREFSWACTHDEKIAVLEYNIGAAFSAIARIR